MDENSSFQTSNFGKQQSTNFDEQLSRRSFSELSDSAPPLPSSSDVPPPPPPPPDKPPSPEDQPPPPETCDDDDDDLPPETSTLYIEEGESAFLFLVFRLGGEIPLV